AQFQNSGSLLLGLFALDSFCRSGARERWRICAATTTSSLAFLRFRLVVWRKCANVAVDGVLTSPQRLRDPPVRHVRFAVALSDPRRMPLWQSHSVDRIGGQSSCAESPVKRRKLANADGRDHVVI